MADTSTIEWTDATWNIVTGCDRISPGCANCYIERTIPFRKEGRRFDADGKMGIRLHPDRLDWPLHWRKPRRIFVNSLSDLFHQDVPDEFIADVWGVMLLAACRHTFQVLTKRPQRMAALLNKRDFYDIATEKANDWEGYRTGNEDYDSGYSLSFGLDDGGPAIPGQPLPNVWLGTSIENDRYTFRADHLRATAAAVRFLSLEPLLGPLPSLDLTGIDWCIVGGESGPGARPMHPDWVRGMRDRCDGLGVPFFFKQWGGRTPKAGGREIDGRTWDQMPAVVS